MQHAANRFANHVASRGNGPGRIGTTERIVWQRDKNYEFAIELAVEIQRLKEIIARLKRERTHEPKP